MSGIRDFLRRCWPAAIKPGPISATTDDADIKARARIGAYRTGAPVEVIEHIMFLERRVAALEEDKC
jgi:hypothetical protein